MVSIPSNNDEQYENENSNKIISLKSNNVHQATLRLEKALSYIKSDTISNQNTLSLLTMEKVAKAHDLLFEAISILNSDSKHDYMLDCITLLVDIYRCLLVSTHLLLEMGFNHIHSNFWREEDNERLCRTKNRCMILLHSLSFLYKTYANTMNPQTKPSNIDYINWHDENLPPSNYSFLQSFFQGYHCLISLDWNKESHNEQTELNESERIMINDDYRFHNHQTINENDCIFQSLNPNQIQEEESYLLDIAFSNSSSSKFSPHIENGYDHNQLSLSKVQVQSIPHIIQEGWLFLLNRNDHYQHQDSPFHPNPKDIHTDNNVSLKSRAFCKLHFTGCLIIRTNENVRNRAQNNDETINNHLSGTNMTDTDTTLDSTLIYILLKDSVCDFVICGNTFHFRLDHVKQMHANTYHSHIYTNLLFEIDYNSGDGLTNGYSWVTNIQSLLQSLPQSNIIQDRIQNEWDTSMYQQLQIKIQHSILSFDANNSNNTMDDITNRNDFDRCIYDNCSDDVKNDAPISNDEIYINHDLEELEKEYSKINI